MPPESHIVGWKSTWRDDYLKWICGFANAQGGTLVIGRNDQGKVVGVTGVLGLLEEIPQKVKSHLGILVDVNLVNESGLEYLEIKVDPHPTPISYKGEFHYRAGSTTHVLTGPALTRFMLERFGKTWDDVPVPGVGLSGLDEGLGEHFRREAVASGRLPRKALDASLEETIENLQLRDGRYLKRASVLFFHPEPWRFFPEACIKIGAFDGNDLRYQDVIKGPLFSQLDRTMDLLYTKYFRGLVSYEGIQRIEKFPVPREAMREAVLNALIHRDYASPSNILIRVYSHQVEIWNAAHLSPSWKADQLAGKLRSQQENPLIAGVFFRAGMIEAWGRGIPMIIDTCRKAGVSPSWDVTHGNDGLFVHFRFSEEYRITDSRRTRGEIVSHGTGEWQMSSTAVIGWPEKSQKMTRTQDNGQKQTDIWPESSQTTPEKQPESRGGATPINQRILRILSRNPSASRRLLAEMLGSSEYVIRHRLDKLRAEGKIARVGPDKGGQWKVLDL